MDGHKQVAILGWGAIGRAVGSALVAGQVPGAQLRAVADRPGRRPSEASDGGKADIPVPVVDPVELADGVDIVVEAAGQEALTAHGQRYLEAGCHLLVVSVGALVDDELFARLRRAGGRRLHLTSGAIGGLDLIRAAGRAGPLTEVTLTTTKPPGSLIQEWMDDDLVDQLRAGRRSVTVFDGPAAEAVARFPQSVNVAATLALCVGSWDDVGVRIVADPAVETNRHEIEVAGAAGHYAFRIENQPSADNPRTSGIVAPAVLQGLASLCGDDWRLAAG